MMGGTQCSMAAGVGVGAGVHRATAPRACATGSHGARGSGLRRWGGSGWRVPVFEGSPSPVQNLLCLLWGPRGPCTTALPPRPGSDLPALWFTLPTFLENTIHFPASGPWYLQFALPGTPSLRSPQAGLGHSDSLRGLISYVTLSGSACQQSRPDCCDCKKCSACSGSPGAQASNKHPWKTSSSPSSHVVPPCPRAEGQGTHSPPSPSSPANTRDGSGGAWSQAFITK